MTIGLKQTRNTTPKYYKAVFISPQNMFP